MTAGSIPPNPVELINSAKMSQMLNELRKQFDYIIIDTPPVGDISDALVAAKFANGVLLVTRHNYCTRAALCDAVQQFEFVDAKILGIVFNCVGEKSSKYNYRKYADQYGYQQRYNQNLAVENKDDTVPVSDEKQ